MTDPNETRSESQYFPPEWTDFECHRAVLKRAASDWIFSNMIRLGKMSPAEITNGIEGAINTVKEPIRRGYHV